MIKEDVRLQKKKDKWNLIIFIFFVVSSAIFLIYTYRSDDFSKSFEGNTIGLITRIENCRRFKCLRYYFYIEDKKILSGMQIRNFQGNPQDLVNKFFKVKYDLNNPDENEIFFREELETDSLMLVKSGFVKTKYYEYDDVSKKYLEKLKWK